MPFKPHLILLLLLLASSPASACLNDRETAAAEKEFRSSYESSSNPGTGSTPPASLADPSALPSHYDWNLPSAFSSVGAVFLIAGTFYIGRRRLHSARK